MLMKKSTTRLLLGIALASILLLVIVGCYRYRQQKEKTDKELSIATPTVDTSAYPIAQTIYLRKDEQADMLSGTVHLPREGELLLYFPVGKRSVVYLSGPDYTESHAILSNLRSQCVQRPCRE
ncbi:MAG: hypothetical protein LBP53_01460 [Candidatus Peribacteria bacterium]|nr:hypothetical protein [Candidatus Peribacteria bacterium]